MGMNKVMMIIDLKICFSTWLCNALTFSLFNKNINKNLEFTIFIIFRKFLI